VTTPPSLILVGTDTGVGKTTLACGLLSLARERGLRLVPYKPVETGCGEGPPLDALRMLNAAGVPALELADVCPYAFSPPLAPSIAARLAGSAVDLEELLRRGRLLTQRGDALLVEGAGGLLSPYGPDFSAATLAARLDLDVVVVAPNRLGTINHTALTIAECRRQGLKCLGFVLVDLAPVRAPDQDFNLAEIAAITGLPALGVLPYLERPEPAATARRIADQLDVRTLFGGRLS
jgi:dethiobiotin synthetase